MTRYTQSYVYKALLFGFVLLFPLGAFAQLKSSVLPKTFLRQYDPITVTFTQPIGPQKAGAEDNGERYFTIRPQQTGAYKWLDSRTLEFRPAGPWPALSRLMVTVAPKASKKQWSKNVQILYTMLPRPSSMLPSPGSEDVKQLTKIKLTFPQALPVGRLKRAIRVQIDPFMGTSSKSRKILTYRHWWLKKMGQQSGKHAYWLIFRKALPKAKKITVKIRLAIWTKKTTYRIPMWSGSFRTQRPFFLQNISCNNQSVSIAWGKASYPQQRALDCGGTAKYPTLVFSRAVGAINPGLARQMIRVSPTVTGLNPSIQGRNVVLKGRYHRNVLYKLTFQGAGLPIKDRSGQMLQHHGEQVVFFFLGKKRPFLRWDKGKGIIEKFGPQMMPLHVRGIKKVDLRIYRIPSGDSRFWPFPKKAVSLNEATRPPGPGEKQAHPANPSKRANVQILKKHLKILGTPLLSKVVTLPADPEGEGHHFGLNLKPHIQKLLKAKSTKKWQGTHFLVGLRLLDGSPERRYVWTQITDLSLTAVEDKGHVQFVVTSIKTAQPVSNATVALEGFTNGRKPNWKTLWTGTTDKKGLLALPVRKGLAGEVIRIRVHSGQDQLLLDTKEPPPVFTSNHWWPSYRRWLSWTNQKTKAPAPEKYRAHLFTERPVYRPGEAVHVKGIIREMKAGTLQFPTNIRDIKLLVKGPKNKRWTFAPLSATSYGGVYQKFNSKGVPQGAYTAQLVWFKNGKKVKILAGRHFKIEAYRLPLFEVKILSKAKVPADKPFKISTLARYYAGGLVTQKQVKWRVVESSLSYRPPGKRGYHFASSFRYGSNLRTYRRVLMTKTGKLNNRGHAYLKLDPTKSLELRPRRYNIEAVITGPDGRTVAGRRSIKVLPPFAVGVKLPRRFKQSPGLIKANLIAVDFNGKLIPGRVMEVQLLRREWHAQLVETDFVKGRVKYKTDIVDKAIGKCKIKSGNKPVQCPIKASRSGVYILRVKSRDKMGRLQTVSVDLYVHGKKPVQWERPESGIFKLTLDKRWYQSGQQAKILIRSPFQKARALLVLEDPAGTRYRWVQISNGRGLAKINIQRRFAPSLAAHVILMRGRIANPLKKGIDPGRPRTVASSIRIPVSLKQNKIMLALAVPAKAQPKEYVNIGIQMKTPSGKPLAGEVTLWVVDRAALSLGKEGPLDPTGRFVKRRRSNIRVRDTRNLVIGRIARRSDNPGGDAGGDAGGVGSIVRRNFKSVPYYNPAIKVGPDGKVTVRFKLPDDLTTFAVRAVAVSKTHRFGFRSKSLRVRLPLMVQRTLPRFIRPGDAFTSGGIARIIDGPTGKVLAQVRALGLQIVGKSSKIIKVLKNQAAQAFFKMSVPQRLSRSYASVEVHVKRLKDNAKDAFRVKLPIRPDRKRVYIIKERTIASTGSPFSFMKNWPEAIRKGSGRMEILFAGRGEVLRSVAALEYLMEYPYGCTEQRVSRAYPLLVMERTLGKYALRRLSSKRIKNAINETIRHLESTANRSGLYGYWAGDKGHIWLTAYIVPFLIEAKKAGYSIPTRALNNSLKALRRSLRSDFSWKLSPSQLGERAEVLYSLALAGRPEAGYIRGLYTQRNRLSLFARTRLLLAMLKNKKQHRSRIRNLSKELWAKVVWKKNSPKLQIAGIRFARTGGWYRVTLESPTRTLAGMLEALAESNPNSPQLESMKSVLLSRRKSKKLGFGLQHSTGWTWGSTQENARVLLALRSFLKHKPYKLPTFAFQWAQSGNGGTQWTNRFRFGGARGVWQARYRSDSLPSMRIQGGALAHPLWIRARISYIPAKKGSQVKSLNRGFHIQRSTEVLPLKGKKSRYFVVKAGVQRSVPFGSIMEETVQMIVNKTRFNVAVEIPIAAGLEVMNPTLKTSSSQAATKKKNTYKPTHVEYLDDRVRFFFTVLPAGRHSVHFRVRATTKGNFVYPAAHMELMYRPSIFGRSTGYPLIIQ